MNEQINWEMVAALGQLGGAVATFLAVVVALWVAYAERRVRLKVRAMLQVLTPGDGSGFEDVITISITNYGHRSVHIAQVGWRTGWSRRGPDWLKFQHAISLFNHPVSAMGQKPPFELEPGRAATLFLAPEAINRNREHRETFFGRRYPFRKKVLPTKVCVIVSVTANRDHYARADRGLENFLATGVIERGAAQANEAAAREASERPSHRADLHPPATSRSTKINELIADRPDR